MANAIEVRGLRKLFAGKLAVDGVSLEVKEGEIFGFLGPNGSGKTTTIRLICGLMVPDGGEGTCLGYDILTESAYIKRHIGYMTQKFSMYGDLSVEENLDFVGRMYGLEDRGMKVEHALENLGLGGYECTALAGELSGGWKQRLALAGAIMHDPKLLLLDEPTAGVDPRARKEFWDEIDRLSKRGITSLVTTHYMDEAERCHRLAYLEEGKLLAEGGVDEVFSATELGLWRAKK